MTNNKIIIEATELWDGFRLWHDPKFITIEGKFITEVTEDESTDKADFSGIVTPAFIDAHSHIGMVRYGEAEGEVNDRTTHIAPLNDPINSIYFDDLAFKEAVDWGVLYGCVIPGSGNLIGGKAKVIKYWTGTRKNAEVLDYGYKMALGYNPRSTTNWKGTRPDTRMGIYSELENTFDCLLDKRETSYADFMEEYGEIFPNDKDNSLINKELPYCKEDVDTVLSMERLYNLKFTPNERALLEILEGKKTCKVHVHKEDDIYYLIDLKNKYNLKIAVDHVMDITNTSIFDELAMNDIPIVYGPIGTYPYKSELRHDYWKNVKYLIDSKPAFYGLMTDHPIITTPCLRDSLKYFLVEGLSKVEAMGMITFRNAEILGIQKHAGSIAPEQRASLLIWDKDPFDLSAIPKIVIAEGKIVRNYDKGI